MGLSLPPTPENFELSGGELISRKRLDFWFLEAFFCWPFFVWRKSKSIASYCVSAHCVKIQRLPGAQNYVNADGFGRRFVKNVASILTFCLGDQNMVIPTFSVSAEHKTLVFGRSLDFNASTASQTAAVFGFLVFLRTSTYSIAGLRSPTIYIQYTLYIIILV